MNKKYHPINKPLRKETKKITNFIIALGIGIGIGAGVMHTKYNDNTFAQNNAQYSCLESICSDQAWIDVLAEDKIMCYEQIDDMCESYLRRREE